MKSFDEVKVGDVGWTYNDNKVKIIEKGIGIADYDDDLFFRDTSGAMEAHLLELTKEDANKVEMVAVEFPDGSEAVYVYGGGGVTVKDLARKVSSKLIEARRVEQIKSDISAVKQCIRMVTSLNLIARLKCEVELLETKIKK